MLANSGSYDAKAFANLILDWADSECVPVTPLKLQKLLFFIHADYLLETGQPLIVDSFEAWSYGPVSPSVYHEFKTFAGKPITSRAKRFNPLNGTSTLATVEISEPDQPRLRTLFQMYVRVSAGQLSQLSHAQDGPWSKALEKYEAFSNPNRRISTEMIAAHHRPTRGC